MNKLILVSALIAPLATGCLVEDEVGSIDNQVQSMELYSIIQGAYIAGSSAQLERESNEVEVEVDTTATPGDAYTLWLCGFDSPQDCQGPGNFTDSCSMAELFAGAGGAFCQHAAGAVAAADGSLVLEGDSDNLGADILGSNGIDNYEGAEITLVVRTHGPALSGDDLADQLSTFNGGCNEGQANVGLCNDEQAAMFAGP